MSVELMVTRALLEDGFTPVLRKIAGEQDAYARKTAGMNMGGNALIGMGAGLLGIGIKSLQVAGQLDEIRKSMEAVEGAQKAAFDMSYIDKFAQHSKFTYLELAESGKRLALAGVPVKDYLTDVADLAAASGKPLTQVAKLYDTMLAGHNVSLALSARGGFSQFYLSPEAIFKAAGKPYIPGKTKLVGSMTPQEVAAAVHKVLISTGRAGLNEKLARTTMSGVEGMITDALTRVGNNVASGSDLNDTVHLLATVADELNKVADAAAKIPHLGKDILYGGAGLIAAGGILKAGAAWRDYRSMLLLTKIAGEAERAGEKAKVPIAEAEAGAVGGSAKAYGGLRGMLVKVGTATLGANAETVGMSRVMLAGIGTIGLYGVAFAGLVYDIKLVVDSFQELNKASRDADAAMAAVNKARGQGYDLKDNAGKATGYNALPVWKQYGEEFVNGAVNGVVANPWVMKHLGLKRPLIGPIFNTDGGGFDALTDAHSRALAKKHGMPKNGVRATMMRDAKAKADAAAQARRDAAKAAAKEAAAAAGDAANKYELSPALSFKLKQDERRIELLKAMGGHERDLKAARAQEIADLNTAAGLLEKQAGLATDIGKKYALMDQAADDRQKAKLMALDKGDKQNALDKFVAKIFGGGGIGEDDVLKRTGVGRGWFAGRQGGKSPVSPLHAALATLQKRPLVVNVKIGDKTFEQIKAQITDDALAQIVRVGEGSSMTKLFN